MKNTRTWFKKKKDVVVSVTQAKAHKKIYSVVFKTLPSPILKPCIIPPPRHVQVNCIFKNNNNIKKI